VSGSEEGNTHELVIIRRRGHSEEGGHHGGVWKIAYADFMTAMMAFFLVMWLINSTDKKTLTQVATYFNPLRLTDKRPAPKGLHEPDGSESTQTAPATGKGAKPKEGKGKGATKRDESEVGEVRARGEEFKRGNDAQKQATEAGVGGDPDYSARHATGRAYRDPFDAVPRSEIMPGEPASGRAEERSAHPPTPEPAARQSARDAPERPSAAHLSQPGKGAAKDSRDGEAAKEAAKGAKDGAMAAHDNAAAANDGAKTAKEAAKAGAMAANDDAAPAKGGTKEAKEVAKAAGDGATAAGDGAAAAKDAEAATQAAREAAARADAAGLEAAIKQAIAEALPGSVPNIEVKVVPEGVLISLTDDYEFGMFAIASAEPRPAMVVVMDKLAKILAGRQEPLIVRGHTDRRPYRTATYDNWRLSAARAHAAYTMLARGGIDEKRFERIEGYADRALRVPDDPEAAQNRRIEILLRKQGP
jgi:chemotaxis protein MotB